MNISSTRAILIRGTALAALILPSLAAAQTEPQATEEGAAGGGEILVTGSRIKKDGFDSPVPVTVVDAGLIQNLGQTNAAEVVKLMPQNIASQSDATSGTSLSANAGSQFANLRGLNPTFGTRTLTLVNTRRFIPTSDGGQVDLNLIPSVLIGRVETVTGGASAAYGSDAIAGVVNIILDNTFTGFKGQIDYGQTGRGDGKSLHAAAAYGLNFADGRGHIMIGGEYQRNKGIGQCADVREWCAESWGTVANQGAIRPGYDRNDRTTLNQNQAGRSGPSNTVGYNVPGSIGAGLPNFIIGRGLGLVYNSTYGVIRNFYQAGSTTGTAYNAVFPAVNPPPALVDKVFSPNGQTVSDYDPGLFGPKLVGGVALGGDNDGAYRDQYIQTPVKRYSTYLAAEYELSDALKISTELSYADRKANSRSLTAATRSTMSIQADNAFLSPALAAIMNAPQAPGSSPYPIAPYTFSLGKDPDDELDNEISVDAQAFRGVLGLSGSLFADWTWDAYYQYGENKRFSSVKYSRHNDAFFMAIDAVRQDPANPNSQIICRPLNEATIAAGVAAGRFSSAYVTQLRALNAACKPLNLFGSGNMNPEAIAFAWRPAVEDFKFRQHVLSASVQGTAFQGWGAGPISVAAGLDYRDDKGDVTHGGVNPNDYAFSFGLDYAGKISVIEGFFETNVPVFRDSALGDMFELNGAIRYTKNKSTDTLTSQSRTINATSWKVGGIYDVFDGLRFRATQSRDIRAAGFRELFMKTAPTESGTAQGRVNNFNKTNPATGGVVGADPADATPIYSGGNFTLAPEKADTTTAGVVFSPTFMRGFRISLDWYQIKLKDAIANLSGQRVVDLCRDSGLLCDRVTFASPLDITRVNAGSANVGLITTRGFDFEASYRLPLSDLKGSLPGSLDLRFLLNHTYDFVVQQGPGAVARDYAGQSGPVVEGGDFYPSPKWMWNALIGYSTERFNYTLTVRHVGKGILNVERIGPEDPGYAPNIANSITTNRVNSATYFNVAMSYKIPLGADIDQNIEVFGAIENLLDKKPPVAPGTSPTNPAAYPTNPVYFDTFGMRWKAGARLKF
ncbi:TonB-dependent receptor domain-containing protein [Sphingobium nicotianae]|uniref:TonB-dependent receptor n=1 Tax=Sphingobium nicotianae TaxID=2782607 RepID=A0A9X1DF67_9SPHN|nr:TonB-dependent receptor [Sphingobium nicotianae]MBT2189122.1 TonB-dependent receptor [Sphingobium nicotianae]